MPDGVFNIKPVYLRYYIAITCQRKNFNKAMIRYLEQTLFTVAVFLGMKVIQSSRKSGNTVGKSIWRREGKSKSKKREQHQTQATPCLCVQRECQLIDAAPSCIVRYIHTTSVRPCVTFGKSGASNEACGGAGGREGLSTATTTTPNFLLGNVWGTAGSGDVERDRRQC